MSFNVRQSLVCDICHIETDYEEVTPGTQRALPVDWKRYGSVYGEQEDASLHLGPFRRFVGDVCGSCLNELDEGTASIMNRLTTQHVPTLDSDKSCPEDEPGFVNAFTRERPSYYETRVAKATGNLKHTFDYVIHRVDGTRTGVLVVCANCFEVRFVFGPNRDVDYYTLNQSANAGCTAGEVYLKQGRPLEL